MGAKHSNSARILKTVGLTLLAAGSFAIARFQAPPEPQTTGITADRAPSPGTPPDLVLESSQLAANHPLGTLNSAFSSGERFNIHYTALLLTQNHSPQQIGQLLLGCADFEGSDADIVSLIFALDLAYRDPNLLTQVLRQTHKSGNRYLDLSSLFYYWASAAPQDAFDTALKLPQHLQRQAFQGVSRSGIREIKKQVEAYLSSSNYRSSGNSESREKAIQAIAQKSWKSDPEGFLRFFSKGFQNRPLDGLEHALEIDDPHLQSRALDSLRHSKWEDPIEGLKTALALVDENNIPNPQKRRGFIANIINRAGPEHYIEAIGVLEAATSPQERAKYLPLIQPGDHKSIATLLSSSFIQSIPDSPRKTNFLRNTLNSFAHTDWERSLELLNQHLPTHIVEQSIPILANNAYRIDGSQAAIHLLEATSSNELRTQTIQQLANSWGQKDPLGYLSWTLSEPNQAELLSAQKNAINYWAKSDMESLRLFESEVEEGQFKTALQQGIGVGLAASDPYSAIEYASTISDIEAAVPIVSQAAYTLSQTEPRAAAELIVSIYPDNPSAQRSLQRIGRTWADSDPQAASVFFSNLPESHYTTRALASTLQRWVHQDQNAAIDFITNLPSGNRRDQAITNTGLLHSLQNSQSDDLPKLLEMIENPELRTNLQKRHLNPGSGNG
ncbi:hypothetical protein [Pelagicoccus mobilis]|uniref:HEAT repeat domain-containing protein n=1 Tax=Pelagicoccus mobilis TaxID=415221 RepID=A0A934VTB4_9BACT|nr:hypothetical protein [Pelagicoccus mobilis]MBK1879533.1 hypothetical protein [Pelagicoccus mobilis]